MLRVKLGEGITGTVAVTGSSLLIPNALECEYAVQVPGTPEIDESMVAVPLAYSGRTSGVIVLSKLGVGQFDGDDVRLLEVLGGQASVALENARLYEAQRREARSSRESAEIANALLLFSQELAAAEGMDEVLDRLVELSGRILSVPRTSVWLQDAATRELMPRALWGYDELREAQVRELRFGGELAAGLAGLSKPFVLEPEDLEAMGFSVLSEAVRVAVAPLRIDDARVGCLVVSMPLEGGRRFDDRKMRLLEGIAHQAKLAIATASSFEDLERTFLSTVEALANALEASDEYTSSHARTITDLALQVGGRSGSTRRRSSDSSSALSSTTSARSECRPTSSRSPVRSITTSSRSSGFTRSSASGSSVRSSSSRRSGRSFATVTSGGTAPATRTASPVRRFRWSRASSSSVTLFTR